jgi:Zn-dependent protease
MQEIDFIFGIAILIMSVVVHEVSHGYAANLQGDPTARMAGRLTLNPIKHLDFIGSFIVPVFTFFATISFGGFIFGWAKPVPYNPYNLRNQRWGPAIVGIAGPASNLAVAIIFGILIRFSSILGIASLEFIKIASMVVMINIVLAVFNIIPIPPLDGSKVLFSTLPYHMRYIQDFLERYQYILIFVLIFFLWRLVLPIVFILFKLIAGFSILF